MTYDELALSYKEVTSGYDEPDIMWMLGSNLKFLAQRHHDVADPSTIRDIDGNPIYDSQLYALTKDGIIPTDEDGNRIRFL